MTTLFHPIAILAILVALTVHEWAHAITATRLGDPTPANQGRLTLNPIAHLDPLGAILFLLAGFGWAKPVPVNPGYFQNPRMGMLLTAAAGPFSNLILAFIAFITLALLGDTSLSVWSLLSAPVGRSAIETFFLQFCTYSLFTNLGLMAFNLLPIGPLDGSKVLEAFIPLHQQDRYADYLRVGPYILLFLLLSDRILGVSLLGGWMMWIMEWVLRGFAIIVPF